MHVRGVGRCGLPVIKTMLSVCQHIFTSIPHLPQLAGASAEQQQFAWVPQTRQVPFLTLPLRRVHAASQSHSTSLTGEADTSAALLIVHRSLGNLFRCWTKGTTPRLSIIKPSELDGDEDRAERAGVGEVACAKVAGEAELQHSGAEVHPLNIQHRTSPRRCTAYILTNTRANETCKNKKTIHHYLHASNRLIAIPINAEKHIWIRLRWQQCVYDFLLSCTCSDGAKSGASSSSSSPVPGRGPSSTSTSNAQGRSAPSPASAEAPSTSGSATSSTSNGSTATSSGSPGSSASAGPSTRLLKSMQAPIEAAQAEAAAASAKQVRREVQCV